MTVHDARQRHLGGAGHPVGGRICKSGGDSILVVESGGTLQVDGTPGGTLAVMTAGRLSGTGTVGIVRLGASYSDQIGDDTRDHGVSTALGAVLTRE